MFAGKTPSTIVVTYCDKVVATEALQFNLDSTLKSSFVSRGDIHLQATVIYQTGQQRKELSGSLGSIILALLALSSAVDFSVCVYDSDT